MSFRVMAAILCVAIMLPAPLAAASPSQDPNTLLERSHIVCGADPLVTTDGGCMVAEFDNSIPTCRWQGTQNPQWVCDVEYYMTLTLTGSYWCGGADARENNLDPGQGSAWAICSGVFVQQGFGPIFGPHTFPVPPGGTNLTIGIKVCISQWHERPSDVWKDPFRCKSYNPPSIFLPGPPSES